MKRGAPRRPRVAVCEDESVVALSLMAFLQRAGYDPVGPYAAAEPLVESAGDLNLDLALMDIHLRGPMDGIQAAAILLDRWTVPVIFLTAYADEPTIERAKVTQPYAYVQKPYDERELRTAIVIGLYRAGMERRLRYSEARYRVLFEEGLSAVFLADAEGRASEGNQAFRDLAGGETELRRIFGPEGDEVLAAMGRGEGFGPRELRMVRPDGSVSWVLLSVAPLRRPEGGERFQCQAVDVTERKALLDRIGRAQRMEAMARIAGGAAHDFNNVLTAILGYSRLLRDRADATMAADLAGIDEAARRASNLTRQLLVFSRKADPEPCAFSLSEMASGIERLLGRLLDDGFTLRLRNDGGADFVLADRGGLEQVVMNLVVNARDAMPSGGRIVVETGATNLERPLDGYPDAVPAGTWAWLRVVDEGVGIAADVLPRIFEPFFTTKGPDRGTGLGLATVASIVRRAGGKLDVATSPRGTTFTVYLPPVVSGANLPACEEPDEPPAGRGETVLLVEVDGSVRAALEAMLERSGYIVTVAGNPGEALLMAERMSGIDALVSDGPMPLMRGEELAGRLRRAFPGMRALYLSPRPVEDGTVADAATASQVDAVDAWLPKPFAEYDLLVAVRNLLDAGLPSGSGKNTAV